MENHNLQEYLQSIKGLEPMMVDDALFEVILEKSKQRKEKIYLIAPKFIKYAAAVIVVLVTVNCWSLVKLTHHTQQEQPVSASAELVSDYNINR